MLAVILPVTFQKTHRFIGFYERLSVEKGLRKTTRDNCAFLLDSIVAVSPRLHPRLSKARPQHTPASGRRL
jgi:hypothetical protein